MNLFGLTSLGAEQVKEVLTDTAYLYPRTQSRTKQGAVSYTYAKGAEVRCAIQPKAGGEYLGRGGRGQKTSPGDRIDERRDDIILLPPGTAVTMHDRIEIVGRGLYEVTLVQQRSTELLLEIEAREVED